MPIRPLVLLLILLVSPQLSLAETSAASDREAIGAILDDFHAAADDADQDRYLGYFAEDGVFMGTDDWERWPLPEFTEYVSTRFSSGVGWSYTPEKRHIMFSDDGNTAWFDEVAVSSRWGRFRGTGVLLRRDGLWKIAHYSLTVLVPNENWRDVAEVTVKGFADRAAKANGPSLEESP